MMDQLMAFFRSNAAKWMGGAASLLLFVGFTYANITGMVEQNAQGVEQNRRKVEAIEQSVSQLKEDNREILTEIKNLNKQNERILSALEKDR